jgi:hypothetical protein
MKEDGSARDPPLPFPDLVHQPRLHTFVPAGWIPVGGAIAWVGFANAVRKELWDSQLALGLSLWPWFLPHTVLQRLGEAAEKGATGSWYTEERIRGHRSYLVGALRLMSIRRIGAAGPISLQTAQTAQFDPLEPELRAEAVRCRDAWDQMRSAISAAFLRATLASDAIRLSVAEGRLAAYGVPTAREGAELDVMPREAIPPSVFAAPVTLTPDGLYPFTPEDSGLRAKQGPSFVDVLLPARDLARAFPRAPGKAPDVLAAALDRMPEPGEADAMAAQQEAKIEELMLRTGAAGRPSSMHLIRPEHSRRLAAGEAHASLSREASHLREWLSKTHPKAPLPGVSALKNAIRGDHPQHLKSGPRKKAPS